MSVEGRAVLERMSVRVTHRHRLLVRLHPYYVLASTKAPLAKALATRIQSAIAADPQPDERAVTRDLPYVQLLDLQSRVDCGVMSDE